MRRARSRRNPLHARADLPGMRHLSPDDPDALTAIADAAIDEPVEDIVVPHPAAPELRLELLVDGGGIVAATWRLGGAWWAAEVGEG